ncbi:MAG: serine hydrolase domain-containing protein [Myxococcaceae bacterium]
MGVSAVRAPLLVLLPLVACSHAPPASSSSQAERRDEWLVALRSDVDRIASADSFQGQLRVVHGGTAEIDQTFGPSTCLPLGSGRRLLAAIAVGVLVQEGTLGFEDRLDRRLPSARGTSYAGLSVANLLTDSAGLAPTTGASLADRLDAAGKVPLQGAGSRVDPDDDRPWLLVERLVAQASGEAFEPFVERRVAAPAGMGGTSLGPTSACADSAEGTTTLEDQFRLIDALRTGTVLQPATRDALWAPRLPLGPGSEVGYGLFVRTNGEQRAVGLVGGGAAPAYELWLDPVGTDALVLLGRTPARTARGIRTALGEFYALPPGPPQPGGSPRRSVAH